MQRTTILVVDDRHDDREFISTLLTSSGYSVLQAENIQDGLVTARSARPDLVITDVVMKDGDGYEFAGTLRAEPEIGNVPIIFWTAVWHNERNALALAEKCGVDAVMSKPTEPDFILETVGEVLRRGNKIATAGIPSEFHQEHALLLGNKVLEQTIELEASHAKLYASESQNRAFFERNPFPIWIADAESKAIVAVNDAAIRQYGYSRQEFCAMFSGDLIAREREEPVMSQPPDCGPDATLCRHRLRDGRVIDVIAYRQEIIFEVRSAVLEMMQDVTEQLRRDKVIRDAKEQIHQLANKHRLAQEEERSRISRHLHDELGQQLTALRMTMHWLLKRMAESKADFSFSQAVRALRSSLKEIDSMIATVQEVAKELRPGILDFGIGGAVEWLTQDFASRADIACKVQVPESEETLDPVRATETYRILQEALTNVGRHSGASLLEVDLRREGGALVLEVRDNGKGISVSEVTGSRALGLLGMRERAELMGANLSIRGTPNAGTTVRLELPFAAKASAG